jgi:hypothetical protein
MPRSGLCKSRRTTSVRTALMALVLDRGDVPGLAAVG